MFAVRIDRPGEKDGIMRFTSNGSISADSLTIFDLMWWTTRYEGQALGPSLMPGVRTQHLSDEYSAWWLLQKIYGNDRIHLFDGFIPAGLVSDLRENHADQ